MEVASLAPSGSKLHISGGRLVSTLAELLIRALVPIMDKYSSDHSSNSNSDESSGVTDYSAYYVPVPPYVRCLPAHVGPYVQRQIQDDVRVRRVRCCRCRAGCLELSFAYYVAMSRKIS